ncbi:MAG: PD-(D/E)XK nuclease family protein [Acidobacteriota bacterium]|nr:PD-(D/E)XK nuclease family protein [Acidobacteriota bacterium]
MPTLRFAPYREIAREIAARLVASRRGCDPLAPWAEEVIVPSRGVAEAIAGELVARMPNGIAGLRLHTLEELAQQILVRNGQTPRVASDIERRLAMRVAIRSVDHPMMESRGVASMLERAYRDVRDSGLTLADLARRAQGRNLRNARRSEAIGRAWREYERLIGQLHAIDAADRMRDAAALCARSAIAPQLLAGFYDMTGAQFQLLEALLRSNQVAAMWVPTEEPFAQRFVRAITQYSEVVRDPAIEIRRAQQSATQYDTRLDELRDVCARVAELLANGTPASDIGIVARSLEPYDARLLNRFANEQGFATTMNDEIPLAAHRVGRGAITLLRLRERGFPRADVFELVRDGLHIRTRINVDESDLATRRARIAGGTSDELRAIRNRKPALDDYLALVKELEELTASLDVAQLGSLFKLETEHDLAAAEALDEIAAVFARASIWHGAFAAHDVIDAIEHESLRCERDGDDRPIVWAGELLRFRGRSFTHLFVVRMQDDVFPQRRTEDPLLPDSDRQQLGVREIGDGREEEALLFSLLSDASRETHFCFATGDGFGKVLRKSRYLRTMEAASRPSATAQAHQPPQRTTRHSPRPLQLLVRSGTSGPFDGILGPLATLPRALSPTQLEDFGECPQKFLWKHILGVTDIDHPERELQINPRDKGTIDHKILERFYRATSEDDLAQAAAALPRIPDALASRLDAFIDEEFDRAEHDSPPFNRTIRNMERRATKRLLREFLAHDLGDLDAQQLVPRFFEYRFGTKHREEADHPEPFVVDAGGVPVRVEGTIDRIDAGNGRYRIVDYKSGKAGRHQNLGDKIDRGVRLQLALYSMAVAEFFGVAPENVAATIKPLVVADLKPEKFAFALHEKRDALLETLEIFMRAILAGRFPAFPNEHDLEFNSCKYCPVNHSCRTKHDTDERYAVAQHKDPRTLLGESA